MSAAGLGTALVRTDKARGGVGGRGGRGGLGGGEQEEGENHYYHLVNFTKTFTYIYSAI